MDIGNALGLVEGKTYKLKNASGNFSNYFYHIKNNKIEFYDGKQWWESSVLVNNLSNKTFEEVVFEEGEGLPKDYATEELYKLPPNTVVKSLVTGEKAELHYDKFKGVTLKNFSSSRGFPLSEMAGKWVVVDD